MWNKEGSPWKHNLGRQVLFSQGTGQKHKGDFHQPQRGEKARRATEHSCVLSCGWHGQMQLEIKAP